MKNILIILAALLGIGVFGQTNIPTRQMLADTNGVVKWPPNITSITIGGRTYTNLLGFGLAITNGQLSIDTTQLPAGGGGGGSGTVTSVGLSTSLSGLSVGSSPVTSSGTITLSGTLGLGSGGTGATDAPGARTALSLVPGTDVQAYDADLAAIAALANSGIIARTGAGTVSARTITGDSEAVVSNGDGVSGNPTLSIGSSIARDSEVAALYKTNRTGVVREIWIPANAMSPGSDTPTASTNTWVTTTDGQTVETWDFSASSTNSVQWTMALPLAWDAGTVKAKVFWKQVAAEATSTNRWAIGGGSIGNGETGGNTLGTLVMITAVGANDTNVVSITDASGAITIGGTPSAGHLTWFTLRRHPGDTGDNSSVLARLFGIHLQYTESATEPSAW